MASPPISVMLQEVHEGRVGRGTDRSLHFGPMLLTHRAFLLLLGSLRSLLLRSVLYCFFVSLSLAQVPDEHHCVSQMGLFLPPASACRLFHGVSQGSGCTRTSCDTEHTLSIQSEGHSSRHHLENKRIDLSQAVVCLDAEGD